MLKCKRYFFCFSCLLLFSACSKPLEQKALVRYSEQIAGNTPAKQVKPITGLKIYKMPHISIEGLRNPFETPLQRKEKLIQRRPGGSIRDRPDLNRRKTLLEKVPLKQLGFVGVIRQQQKLWAVIYNDKTARSSIVTLGDYLGEHYGKIIEITPVAIQIEEHIRDKRGGWHKKEKSLPLRKTEQVATGD